MCLFSFEGASFQREREVDGKTSKAGADDAKDPPVPIPNTEVKLGCAEDTWLETTWKIGRCRLFSLITARWSKRSRRRPLTPQTGVRFSHGSPEKRRRNRGPYAPLAQLVEQLTLNQRAQGSSPWRCTKQKPACLGWLFCLVHAPAPAGAAVPRRRAPPCGGCSEPERAGRGAERCERMLARSSATRRNRTSPFAPLQALRFISQGHSA